MSNHREPGAELLTIGNRCTPSHRRTCGNFGFDFAFGNKGHTGLERDSNFEGDCMAMLESGASRLGVLSLKLCGLSFTTRVKQILDADDLHSIIPLLPILDVAFNLSKIHVLRHESPPMIVNWGYTRGNL